MYVSVEEALKKGDRWIKYPSLATFLLCLLLGFIYSIKSSILPLWGFLSGFIAGTILMFLYNGYATTKWRIWAFRNVNDVHELKKAAITERIIPWDGSWLEKLEIRTDADKRALTEIQLRFEEPLRFFDDLIVLSQTVIYSSRIAGFAIILLSLLTLAIATILFATFDIYPFAILLFIGGCFGIWRSQKLIQQQPVITLTEDGIETAPVGFYDWKEITEERVEFYQAGRNSRYYFRYRTPKGQEEISLQYLDVTPRRLNHLLYVYRHRNENKTKQGLNLT